MLFSSCYVCSNPNGFLSGAESKKVIDDLIVKLSDIPNVSVLDKWCFGENSIGNGFVFVEITYPRKVTREIMSLVQSAGAFYSKNFPSIISTGIGTYYYSIET